MKSARSLRLIQVLSLCSLAAACELFAAERGFVPLFPETGVPKGWVVRAWNDVRNPAEGNPVWKVERTHRIPGVKSRERAGPDS